MQEHIFKQFDADLEAVRSQVLKMGGLVEEQIIHAIDALVTGNTGLADQVIASDHRVNALEVAIDEDCSHIIARRQPTAGDLRIVMMIVKTITDLERIGDEAAKIARMTKLIYEKNAVSSHDSLKSSIWVIWYWKCCVNRWMVLRALKSPMQVKLRARTFR